MICYGIQVVLIQNMGTVASSIQQHSPIHFFSAVPSVLRVAAVGPRRPPLLPSHLGQHKLPQLLVALLQIVVDNDDVKVARLLSERQLLSRLVQPLLEGVLRLRLAAPQPRLEDLHGGRLDEGVHGVEVGACLDLLHPLHLDVQDADLAGLDDCFDGLLARAVHVATAK